MKIIFLLCCSSEKMAKNGKKSGFCDNCDSCDTFLYPTRIYMYKVKSLSQASQLSQTIFLEKMTKNGNLYFHWKIPKIAIFNTKVYKD